MPLVVDVGTIAGTSANFFTDAAGCESSASGSSHRYYARGKFTGLSDTATAEKWLTCKPIGRPLCASQGSARRSPRKVTLL